MRLESDVNIAEDNMRCCTVLETYKTVRLRVDVDAVGISNDSSKLGSVITRYKTGISCFSASSYAVFIE
jgi:hypothetical protein